MVERVQPLKLEDTSTGGEIDAFPTSLNRNEDYIDCCGVTIQNSNSNDSNIRIERDNNNNLQFVDSYIGPITLTELTLNSNPIFGTNYQIVQSLTLSSTTSSIMQDKIILTTPTIIGTYYIQWHAIISVLRADKEIITYLYNQTDNNIIGVLHNNRPSSNTSRETVGGFSNIEFNNESKTFAIQFASLDNHNTVCIEDANIVLWRIL